MKPFLTKQSKEGKQKHSTNMLFAPKMYLKLPEISKNRPYYHKTKNNGSPKLTDPRRQL
jgi:hypothetical protein